MGAFASGAQHALIEMVIWIWMAVRAVENEVVGTLVAHEAQVEDVPLVAVDFHHATGP